MRSRRCVPRACVLQGDIACRRSATQPAHARSRSLQVVSGGNMDIDYYIRNGRGQVVDSGSRRTDALWESVATQVCRRSCASLTSLASHTQHCRYTHTHTHHRRCRLHCRRHTRAGAHTCTPILPPTSAAIFACLLSMPSCLTYLVDSRFQPRVPPRMTTTKFVSTTNSA